MENDIYIFYTLVTSPWLYVCHLCSQQLNASVLFIQVLEVPQQIINVNKRLFHKNATIQICGESSVLCSTSKSDIRLDI